MHAEYKIPYGKESFLPAFLNFIGAGLTCMYRRNQPEINNFILNWEVSSF